MNFSQWLIGILVVTFAIDVALSNRTNAARPKIVGGFPIKIQQVPFLLALFSNDIFVCGGVILSRIWAITAFHCVLTEGKMDPLKKFHIQVGESVSIPRGRRHRIRNLYNYTPEMSKYADIPVHDIVLMRLRDRIQFTRGIRPARLPHEDSEPPEMLRVSGWGRTDRLEIKSSQLLAADVHKVSYEKCVAVEHYVNLVENERHLCYGGAQADACNGDSGGPLADSSTVYGIVSFGHGCAIFPGVYVKVSFYRKWIKQVTKI